MTPDHGSRASEGEGKGEDDREELAVRKVSDEEFEAALEESIERHRSILHELAKR